MEVLALCLGVFLVVLCVAGWCVATHNKVEGETRFSGGLFSTLGLVAGLIFISIAAMRLSFGEPAPGSELPSNTVFLLEGTAADGNGYTVLLRHLDGDIEAYEHVDLSRLGPFTKPLPVTAKHEAEKTFLVPFAAPEAAIPAK